VLRHQVCLTNTELTSGLLAATIISAASIWRNGFIFFKVEKTFGMICQECNGFWGNAADQMNSLQNSTCIHSEDPCNPLL
jgi:hypothetical protein